MGNLAGDGNDGGTLCLSVGRVVRQEFERLKAPSRKLEYLAVRVLLKTMLGKEVRIGHEPSGKPFLTGGEYHVSISHTKGYVAVGLHESAQPGIDIEVYGERVRKVESRFIREDEMPERARMESREELYQLLLHWSAKETMYKVLDMAEVDFLQHLKCVLLNCLPPEPLLVNRTGKRTRPVS